MGPMFRRYQFVRFSRSDPWQQIGRLPGVDGLLGVSADTPTPMPDAAIALVRGCCEANDCQYPEAFDFLDALAPLSIADGTAVRLLAGVMADRVGVSEWSDSKRTRLLLSLFGRDIRLTVPRAWVEAA